MLKGKDKLYSGWWLMIFKDQQWYRMIHFPTIEAGEEYMESRGGQVLGCKEYRFEK